MRFLNADRAFAYEDNCGGQVAPDQGLLYGAEVAPQKMDEAEPADLAIPYLQVGDVLILGEDAGSIEQSADLAEESLPLRRRQKSQSE